MYDMALTRSWRLATWRSARVKRSALPSLKIAAPCSSSLRAPVVEIEKKESVQPALPPCLPMGRQTREDEPADDASTTLDLFFLASFVLESTHTT